MALRYRPGTRAGIGAWTLVDYLCAGKGVLSRLYGFDNGLTVLMDACV